jgi:very-short-patch-repair endonuclease
MPGTRKSPNPIRRYQQKFAAREMRNIPTRAERALWQRLKRRQVKGLRFRRQHSIDRFIVDFYCAEARLVIEVDGASHAGPTSDAERQEHLEALGLHVLRVTDAEVLTRLDAVMARVGEDAPGSPSP